MRFEADATVDIELASVDFALTTATPEALAAGANRVLIGGELLQFAEAVPLGGTNWRLRGLLRGRGGTEASAQSGQAAGATFVLLDGTPLLVDAGKLGSATNLAAIGLADSEPVTDPIADAGRTLRPLTPVHPRQQATPDGGLLLQWTRRARGAWGWPDGVETPLNEQVEAYLVELGSTGQPILCWELGRAELELSAATVAQLSADHSGQSLWVRQVGSFAVSEPLLLKQIP